MDFFVAVLLEEIQEYAKFAGKMIMRSGWVVTDATNFFMPDGGGGGVDFATALAKSFIVKWCLAPMYIFSKILYVNKYVIV